MKCIICYKDTNSNTQMSVAVDGAQYSVPLCDEHAESTTIGQIRAKVTDVLSKLRDTIAMAEAIGIDIRPMLQSASTPPTAAPAQSTTPTPTPVITKPVVVQKPHSGPVKVVKPGDKMPKLEEVNAVMEVKEVRGMAGMPLQIQTHSEGACGTTDINVVRVGDDVIQRRLKSLNDPQNAEYTADCLACHGTGTHPITKTTCPKCHGSGSIQLS